MRSFHLHLISDSTGETVSTAARAAVSMFEDVDAIEHSWSLVRTRGQIEKVLGAVKDHPGMVCVPRCLHITRNSVGEVSMVDYL